MPRLRDRARLIAIAATAATLATAGLAAVATPAHAAHAHAAHAPATEPAAGSRTSGEVRIVLDEAFQAQMFKAGVFAYDGDSVTVGMGSSGILNITFLLSSYSTARATTLIVPNIESTGSHFYNGPAVKTMGLNILSVRRTGTTGTVSGEIFGPYDAAAGTQFEQKLPLFAMTAVRAKRSGSTWTMDGRVTLTTEAATTFNTLLKTTVFTPGTPFGTLNARVTSG